VAATPAVTPAPAATPQPTTAGPWASAADASREMQVAIDAARGRAGLNGREVKAIDAPLARFDRALTQQDAEQAREAAGELDEAVRELVEGREVDRDAGARLLDAAEGLLEAAVDLPDR
jgi:hypothetical protein